jgi:hypothetical protein
MKSISFIESEKKLECVTDSLNDRSRNMFEGGDKEETINLEGKVNQP